MVVQFIGAIYPNIPTNPSAHLAFWLYFWAGPQETGDGSKFYSFLCDIMSEVHLAHAGCAVFVPGSLTTAEGYLSLWVLDDTPDPDRFSVPTAWFLHRSLARPHLHTSRSHKATARPRHTLV